MKFVTFEDWSGAALVGLLAGDKVFGLPADRFPSMLAVVNNGEAAVATALSVISEGSPVPGAKLLAPIPRPPRIFCIGLNYASHAAESKMKVQTVPTVFMKLASSVIGPEANVILPFNSTQPDWEVELAVVIGKPGYRISASRWQDHIFGYTILNDLSARDVQLATSQWTLGKSFPTFSPMGPALVTADEIPDPHSLDIRLTLNGEIVQSANTRDLIFRIPQLIEYISSLTPLEPGDVISTGTPEGVGLGRTPQRWLQPGDEMVLTIQGLGELRNKTVAEERC